MSEKTMHTAWLRDGRTVYALSDDLPRVNLWSFNVQSARRGVDCEAVAILAAAAPALSEALRVDVEQSDEAIRSVSAGLIDRDTLLNVVRMMGVRARAALKEAGL